MSLINDALKRAKEAQQQVSVPPPDLPLRPVEPVPQRARRGLGLLVPGALTVVALLGLLLLWQWAPTRGAKETTEVNARTARAPRVTTAPLPAPATQPQAALQPVSPLSPAAATLPADDIAEPADSPVANARESETTDATPVAAPPPPKPAPLRLQGIVFNPKRPSAMINGKLVFIGDKVRDLRVMAIDQDSATLVGAGQTNVLTLPE